MAEKLEFNCNDADLQNLLNNNTTITDFLNNLFSHPENYKQMCAALQAYHRNDGGSPEVHAFEVENAILNADNISGRFRCRFRVKYHYTCSDVHNSAADTINWDFRIADATIYLTGEEVLERDSEEF